MSTELYEKTIEAMGGDTSQLPDGLKTTYLKAMCEALGIDTGGMTDNLESSYYQLIIDNYKGGGSGGGEELLITDANALFYAGARIDIADKLIPLFSPNIKCYSNMFHAIEAEQLLRVPNFSTSNGIDFSYMFSWLSSDVKWEDLNFVLDTSKAEDMEAMFYNATDLTTIPQIDASNCINMDGMFQSCSKLIEVPPLNTSNGAVFDLMFKYCSSLTSIPKIDLNKATSVTAMFTSCKALTNLYLYNIRISIQIASGTSWGHLLTVDSLVHTIKELCTTTTSKTLTMGSTNINKISGLYCKIIDDTDEKKPMELCESTDEGAMTLSQYAMEKGWTIK